MSETLKVTKMEIISNLDLEADDVGSSCGNENYYTYNFLNHIHLPKDKEAGLSLNYNETDDISKVLYSCLHAQSYIYESDCNEESRKLANEYKKSLQSE